MDPALRDRFMALLREEDLVDPSWVVDLDEDDEPPLYTRIHRIEFLGAVPAEERLRATLQIALERIEILANEAAQRAPNRTYFMCVTVKDFDYWRAGEQPIPKVAILVDPKEEETRSLRLALVEPYTEDGIAAATWLAALGREYADRYCVGEETGLGEPEVKRVYVGWRTDPAPNVRSVGSEIRSA